MKKMRTLLLLLFFTLFMFNNLSFATPDLKLTPEQEARYIVVAATTCLSSYSGRVSDIFFDHQGDFGWDAVGYTGKTTDAESHFIVSFRYDSELDRNIYIVCFRGSESKKDWQLNFQTKKVIYGGNSPEEFEAIANSQNPHEKNLPMVHKGFHKYVQSAFSIAITPPTNSEKKLLSDILKEDPKAFLLTTGHSLGGAAATLFAARLIDMGIDPKKIAVVTFGAPAVGNQAFADKFQNQINLLRVVNRKDFVPSSLRTLFGEYIHFGQELIFKTNLQRVTPIELHSTTLYFTLSLKNYFDKFHAAVLRGSIEPFKTEVKNPAKPHVALYTMLTPELVAHPDATYMYSIMSEQYQNFFPSYTLLPDKTLDNTKRLNINGFLTAAKNVQADYALLVKLANKKVSNSEEGKVLVVLEAIFYNVKTGQLENYSTYTTSLNTDINILESIVLESMKIKDDLDLKFSWLNKSS